MSDQGTYTGLTIDPARKPPDKDQVIELFEKSGINITGLKQIFNQEFLNRKAMMTADAALDSVVDYTSRGINEALEEQGDMRGIEAIKPLIKGTFQDFYDDGLKTSISNEAKKQSAFLGSISGMQTRTDQLKKDERVKENEFRKIATMYGKDLNTYQMTEKNRNEIYSKLAEDLKIDELKQIHTNAKINQQNVGRQKGVDPVDMLPMPFTYKIPLSEYQTTGAGYYGGYGAMGGSSIASPGHEEMTEENFKKHLRQSKKQHLIDESKKAGISRRNMELDKINIVADNYAKDNYKIFYEDYQTYVVEALKDMDPAMLEKSLQRLESEVLLKKEFKGI